MKLIDKSAVVAEMERRKSELKSRITELGTFESNTLGLFEEVDLYDDILSFIDTLEVKEVDEQKERMSECPYRQVGCTMYADKILECTGACSWVVDYLNLKKLKAQKV